MVAGSHSSPTQAQLQQLVTPETPAPAMTPPATEAAGPATPTPSDPLNMTSRQQRRLWRHVESIDNFWEHLEEIEPGAVQRLATVAHERRWEVIVLTKRPETVGAIAQVQSQHRLESRGFTLPSVYVVQGSRTAYSLETMRDTRAQPMTRL